MKLFFVLIRVIFPQILPMLLVTAQRHALYFPSMCERLLSKRNSGAISFVLLQYTIRQCVKRGLASKTFSQLSFYC